MPTTTLALDGKGGGGMPMLDIDLNRYPCCLSLHILVKNRKRTLIEFVVFPVNINYCFMLTLFLVDAYYLTSSKLAIWGNISTIHTYLCPFLGSFLHSPNI